MKVQGGSTGLAPLVPQPRRLMGVAGRSHAPAALPPGKTRYPLYRRLGRPVWKGAEKLALTGIRSPDRPARSQSLYGWRGNCPLLTTPQRITSAPNPTQTNPTQQNNTTQPNTTQPNTIQHNTTQHNTSQHNTAQHNPTQANPTQHNPTQHNPTQPNTTQHNPTQHIPLHTLQLHASCNLHVVCAPTLFHKLSQDKEYTPPLRLYPFVTIPKRVSSTLLQLSLSPLPNHNFLSSFN